MVTKLKLFDEFINHDPAGQPIEVEAMTSAHIPDLGVLLAKLQAGVLYAEDLNGPDLADDNRFLISVVMQATAYTLDETTLPADNPPRNVTVTHTTDTTTDTLGDAVVDGTDYDDNVIQETITISADGVAVGTKAFKTVSQVVTASWVQGGGVSDLIEVGFGALLGFGRLLTAATKVFLASLGTGLINAPTITIDVADIESNTIDLSSGTYDGTKEAKVVLQT